MGLGKTVITLSAVLRLLYDYFTADRVLVIAPLRPAVDTWPPEIAKWAHLRGLSCAVAVGTAPQRMAALQQGADITIINVDNVEWLVNHYKQRWPFDMVVIDELSGFKSAGSRRFRAMKRVRKYIKRIVGLTGTPGDLIGLWSQIYLLDEGKALGRTLTGYREQYFRAAKYVHGRPVQWEPKSGAEAEIYKRLEGLCISMKTADYLQLPERLDIIRMVPLPNDAMAQYRQMERDMLLPYADGYIDAGSAAVLSNKLLQMTGGAAYDGDGNTVVLHRAKLDELQQLVDEANGQPLLVFYGYKHELERIQQQHPDAVEVRSPNAVERWNRGEIPMLLAHPASAGHGLNLQAGGSTAVWYSLPWSLELYQQACKRLHRMGQQHTVRIFHLVAKGTIDEHVLDVLSGKAKTQDGLLHALRARIEAI